MLLLSVSLIFVLYTGVVRSAVVVCQHASWSAYRSPPGNFSPSFLDASLCTHGVYAFVSLNSTTDEMIASDTYVDLEDGLGGYKKFVNLKNDNPQFKAMLALGGWTASNYQFAQISANPQRRTKLATNAVSFLKKYGFDGLEVDWLYPDGPQNGTNFALLLADIRAAFEPEGLILTASVPSQYYYISSLDLAAMQESVDFMIMMTYEYNGPWWLKTAIHAPLYLVESTLQEYLTRNVEPSKLVISIPAYGHSYTLADPELHGLGEVAISVGAPGPYTRTPGVLSFHEINAEMDSWNVVWEEWSQTPYAYRGNQWVSFDDQQSTQIKMKYAKKQKLSGGAIWTVGDDNFIMNAFPLLKTMFEELQEP